MNTEVIDQLEITALTGWDDENFYPGFRFKGLSAALLMSSAWTIFTVIAATEESPASVLKKVNEPG